MNEDNHQFNPFRVLSNDERESFMARYLEHLQKRDGEINTELETLSNREVRIHEYEKKLNSILWKGHPLDYEMFYEHLHTTLKESDQLSQKQILWLLIAAKCNRGECYGVERKLKKYKRNQYKGVSDVVRYVLFEEHYHTRILLDACRLFDLNFEVTPPSKSARFVIKQMVYFPDSISDLLIFMGEVVGVHLFSFMYEQCSLFTEDKETEQRLRDLVNEILFDEIGHVALCRSKLGPKSMKLAKKLLPYIALQNIDAVPEIAILAGSSEDLLNRISQPINLPEPLYWLSD